ncbi:hypothetical protein AKO1_012202 [Acrasis kona]|uniref:Uncharacterized protein n=1 Tax=Acrasis kona TaxID=1008807 RepID=A0AAW2ZES5_9EUKA
MFDITARVKNARYQPINFLILTITYSAGADSATFLVNGNQSPDNGLYYTYIVTAPTSPLTTAAPTTSAPTTTETPDSAAPITSEAPSSQPTTSNLPTYPTATSTAPPSDESSFQVPPGYNLAIFRPEKSANYIYYAARRNVKRQTVCEVYNGNPAGIDSRGSSLDISYNTSIFNSTTDYANLNCQLTQVSEDNVDLVLSVIQGNNWEANCNQRPSVGAVFKTVSLSTNTTSFTVDISDQYAKYNDSSYFGVDFSIAIQSKRQFIRINKDTCVVALYRKINSITTSTPTQASTMTPFTTITPTESTPITTTSPVTTPALSTNTVSSTLLPTFSATTSAPTACPPCPCGETNLSGDNNASPARKLRRNGECPTCRVCPTNTNTPVTTVAPATTLPIVQVTRPISEAPCPICSCGEVDLSGNNNASPERRLRRNSNQCPTCKSCPTTTSTSNTRPPLGNNQSGEDNASVRESSSAVEVTAGILGAAAAVAAVVL